MQPICDMLEKLPHGVGHALARVRPGLGKIVSARTEVASAPLSLVLTSPQFRDGESIPAYYTADGKPDGTVAASPPLGWTGVPHEARSLALIVEDADSPTLLPLVHAIAWGLDPALLGLQEHALAEHVDGVLLGHNSYFKTAWLPPDPPPGHGRHRYAFQLFALSASPDLGMHPGRRALVAALRGHLLARGLLIGTYERA
jgi:hypothetical protein